MNYNQHLLDLYESKKAHLVTLFNKLNASTVDEDTNFSWPLLLRIWEKDYASAPVKIMVFGQETYGWNNQTESKIEDNSAVTLTEEYVFHNMGRDRTRSPFWRTVRELNCMLGHPDTNCFAWNNILKFGKEDSYGAPSAGVLKAELEYFNVIPKEVKILDPDVCIFLTGPNYDSNIAEKFTDTEFIPIDGFKPRELVKLKSTGLPKKSFRTYHPGYGQRHKDLYDQILQTIVQFSK